MNCPNCGAVVKEGKFCNYCGAKLPDDTKRVEVNINKRIEDVAEMKRADYETDESKIRQKGMRQDLQSRKVKRISCLVLLGICIISFCYAYFSGEGGSPVSIGIFSAVVGFFLLLWIIWQLITGKW